MSATTNLGAGDLIIEPIAEAVAMYDDLLEQLREFMVSDSRYSSYARSFSVAVACCGPAIEMHIDNP